MTRNPAATGLAGFYRERFNSDPYALMAYFEREIDALAAGVGIEWSSISADINLGGGKYRGKITATEKRFKNKVMVWGDTKRAEQGFDFPFLTFNNNVASIDPETWSGLDALWRLYKEQGGQSVGDAKHAAWLKRQADKAAEREARRAERERHERHLAELITGEKNAYEMAWFRGGEQRFGYWSERAKAERHDTVVALDDEDGSAPYLVKKGVGDIAQVVQLKRMRDRLGEFTAVPLQNVAGDFLGLQRLYADKKLQGTGVKMDGAHCVIGDLETAKRRYVVEGFATGASIFLAEATGGNDVAVIVAFNAGNLAKVCRDFQHHHPGWRLINGADNDRWTPAGNAGVLAALEIHRDMGHWAVLPNFDTLIEEGVVEASAIYAKSAQGKGPTDWNDYHLLAGLEATRKALRSHEVKLRAEPAWFDYTLQRLPHTGLGCEKAALSAIAAGMMLVPIKFGTREVVDAVLERLPGGVQVNRFKIKSRAVWLAKIKMNQARELRSFSADALSRVNHLKVPGVRGEHGNTLLPEHLACLVDSLEGFVIVRAPMGSGKTEKLIAPLMQDAPKAAYIAHRISLIGDAAYRLNTQHYQQVCAAEMPDVSHLACCVNSLTNPKFYNTDGRSWFTTCDTLCIDEASQVVRHTTTGPVDSPVRVMDALTDAMASSRRTILCDADANDSVIELCEMANPDKPITVIEVDGTADHIRVDHSDDESVWQHALELITKGRRVLVANDSAESAKKLAAAVEERNPDARVLLVHKDSKANPAVEAFLDRPNAEATKYDVLIYSPAISSGVSITVPHFEHHIGIFSGNTVSPADAVQMLRRDRTARHYLVGIGHTNKQSVTDREALFRGLVAADVVACEYEETTDEILLRRHKTVFDELYLSCRVSENKARNNFANTLLLMLYADGYQVHHMATDQDAVDASRKNRKKAGEIVFSKRLTLLQSVDTPDEETFARMSRQEIRSETEQAQVDRYNIVHQLGVEEVTEDHVKFFDDRGIAKVVALELLQATEDQAREYDRAQRNARVVLTKHRWKTPVHRFMVRAFDILGLDRYTGEGEFNTDQCRQVMALIRESDESLDMYNAMRLGRYIDAKAKRVCATTVTKSILERLGVSVLKRASNGKNLYRINPEDWQQVSAYVEQRAARGVHSLETHESTTYHEPKRRDDDQPQTSDTSPQPLNHACSGDSDTLQLGGDTPTENYHCDISLRERTLATIARFKPSGITVEQLAKVMTPQTLRIIGTCHDEGHAQWMIEYTAGLLMRHYAVR